MNVALLAEGVDRNNIKTVDLPVTKGVALLAEGVDRNKKIEVTETATAESPSSQRAWIEILYGLANAVTRHVALLAEGVDRNNIRQNESEGILGSPSSQRAWIEIQ